MDEINKGEFHIFIETADFDFKGTTDLETGLAIMDSLRSIIAIKIAEQATKKGGSNGH